MFCSLLSYTGKKTGKSKLLRLFNRKLIWEICKREVFCIYQSVLSVQLICPLSRALSLFLFPYISPSTVWHSLKAAREVGGTTIKLCPLLSYLSFVFLSFFSSSFLCYLFAFALFLFLLIAKSCCTQSKFSLLLHSTDIFTRGIKACTPLSLTLTLTLSLFLTLTLTHFPLSVTVSFTLSLPHPLFRVWSVATTPTFAFGIALLVVVVVVGGVGGGGEVQPSPPVHIASLIWSLVSQTRPCWDSSPNQKNLQILSRKKVLSVVSKCCKMYFKSYSF